MDYILSGFWDGILGIVLGCIFLVGMVSLLGFGRWGLVIHSYLAYNLCFYVI